MVIKYPIWSGRSLVQNWLAALNVFLKISAERAEFLLKILTKLKII
jgi:hypothetical protein